MPSHAGCSRFVHGLPPHTPTGFVDWMGAPERSADCSNLMIEPFVGRWYFVGVFAGAAATPLPPVMACGATIVKSVLSSCATTEIQPPAPKPCGYAVMPT